MIEKSTFPLSNFRSSSVVSGCHKSRNQLHRANHSTLIRVFFDDVLNRDVDNSTSFHVLLSLFLLFFLRFFPRFLLVVHEVDSISRTSVSRSWILWKTQDKYLSD